MEQRLGAHAFTVPNCISVVHTVTSLVPPASWLPHASKPSFPTHPPHPHSLQIEKRYDDVITGRAHTLEQGVSLTARVTLST